ncbi:radical SAM family heme chaperone HemW [Deferribacterales bacterium RsTz2092]|nr:coproporphyrinogen III oxidase [Deferribacterales bacterium]
MGYALYIHLPFCIRKCPYCDFYSEPVSASSPIDSYLNACLTELNTFKGVAIDTIYIGGGTPSIIPAVKLDKFIRATLSTVNYSGSEMTIELNPDSTSDEFISMLSELPITRFSVGVQSLNNDVLRLLGRPHNAEQAKQVLDKLQNRTNAAINADIIYDIPTVNPRAIYETLQELTLYNLEHISAYSYSPDTGYLTTAPTDEPEQTEHVCAMLKTAGYERYEVSNFAKASCRSVHNQKYWGMSEYIGIGAGVHSMLYNERQRIRYSHKPSIESYINNPIARDELETYTAEQAALESVVFGLRQIDGVDIKLIETRTGHSFDTSFLEKVQYLIAQELLCYENNFLRATDKGLMLLNQVMLHLWS